MRDRREKDIATAPNIYSLNLLGNNTTPETSKREDVTPAPSADQTRSAVTCYKLNSPYQIKHPPHSPTSTIPRPDTENTPPILPPIKQTLLQTVDSIQNMNPHHDIRFLAVENDDASYFPCELSPLHGVILAVIPYRLV